MSSIGNGLSSQHGATSSGSTSWDCKVGTTSLEPTSWTSLEPHLKGTVWELYWVNETVITLHKAQIGNGSESEEGHNMAPWLHITSFTTTSWTQRCSQFNCITKGITLQTHWKPKGKVISCTTICHPNVQTCNLSSQHTTHPKDPMNPNITSQTKKETVRNTLKTNGKWLEHKIL